MRHFPCLAYTLTVTLLLSACADTDEPARIEYLQGIAAAGSAEPHLAARGDVAVLSWLEPDGDGTALRYSVLGSGGWGTPRTVAGGGNWFVNWADFPSVVPIDDRLWAAHWLVRKPDEAYAYDVAISLSDDGGETWGAAITPHTDGTRTEHGFVSLFPWQGGVGALWLDGRNMAQADGAHGGGHGSGGMTLRSAVVTADGRVTDPQLADDLVCDCCQTDVALGSSGPVAVYRDRSPDEIRDIYAARAIGGRWQPGAAVAEDGWEIAGCPVNGPAISARGDDIVVAWFTAADDEPRVRLARSRDGAVSFNEPIDIDSERPVGRVGVLLLADGDALVSWLRSIEGGRAELRARRVAAHGGVGPDIVIATTEAGRMSGFPQMAAHGDKVLFAWTDVADGRTSVRSARVDPAAFGASQSDPAPAAADSRAADPAAEVKAREIAFAKTMADRDLDAFASFVSAEAVFFNGNEPLRGREAVVAAWSRFFEGPTAPFSWHPDVVEVLDSGDLALSSGPVLTPDGEPAGRFNSVWRREPDGVWRVVFDKGS